MKPNPQSGALLMRIAAITCLYTEYGFCDNPLEPIHRFTFGGNSPDAGAEIANAPQKDGMIELDGRYDSSTPRGYRVFLATPKLEYQCFTVAVRLRPEAKEKEKGKEKQPEIIPLLVGGYAYRWINLSSFDSGELLLQFNNGNYGKRITGAKLALGKWTTFVITCDLSTKHVGVFMDGQPVAKMELPEDFKLIVVDTPSKNSDKSWMFTNYASGNAMKGAVDELVLFGAVLSDEQIADLCRNRDRITLPGWTHVWTDANSGRTLEGILQSKNPDGNEVKIKRKDSGSVITLKTDRLVEADREFINTWKPE